jgi:hypothetical protein
MLMTGHLTLVISRIVVFWSVRVCSIVVVTSILEGIWLLWIMEAVKEEELGLNQLEWTVKPNCEKLPFLYQEEEIILSLERTFFSSLKVKMTASTVCLGIISPHALSWVALICTFKEWQEVMPSDTAGQFLTIPFIIGPDRVLPPLPSFGFE